MSQTSLIGFTRAKTFAGFAVKEFRQPPYRRLPWHEHHEATIEGLILEVLAETSRAGLLDATNHLPGWLKQARELVHDCFCGPLTLSSVAQTVGVHPSHLARTFRKHYRASIGAYVRHLRIERASREIADTNAPLSAISLRTGFFDQSHFSKVFKQHTGMTPAQFRSAAGARNSRTNSHRAS